MSYAFLSSSLTLLLFVLLLHLEFKFPFTWGGWKGLCRIQCLLSFPFSHVETRPKRNEVSQKKVLEGKERKAQRKEKHYANPAQPHPLLMNDSVDGGNMLLVRLNSIVMHSRRWYQVGTGLEFLTWEDQGKQNRGNRRREN
jgi:hypothetical protein